jgi:predicted nucleic acid-binding protein
VTKFLIDSSAWIHFFNQTSPRHIAAVRRALTEDKACTCGVIITEVLRGVRNSKERKLLLEHFSLLEYFELEMQDYFDAAENAFELKKKGWTTKTIDLLIACIALKNDLVLIHDDRDFEFMAKHFPLKLLNLKVPEEPIKIITWEEWKKGSKERKERSRRISELFGEESFEKSKGPAYTGGKPRPKI